jgi:GGDEF domain-containing protein
VRYGGEEFCFIVNGFYARNTIAGIVEDCVRSIRKAEIEFQKTGDFIDAHPESFIPRDRHAERFVTVSVGYAVFEPSNKLASETAEDRVRRCVDSADQALQRAKDKHRNCVCKYNSKTDQR